MITNNHMLYLCTCIDDGILVITQDRGSRGRVLVQQKELMRQQKAFHFTKYFHYNTKNLAWYKCSANSPLLLQLKTPQITLKSLTADDTNVIEYISTADCTDIIWYFKCMHISNVVYRILNLKMNEYTYTVVRNL